jgi:molybdopterin-guanine dinucleotide biosynthesis protein B
LLGVVGSSGSGKTTLLTQLLPLLRAGGLTVSTIKHTHHSVDMDQPGKDSFRHRQAGATEVMVVSDARWALLRETPAPPSLAALAARMAPVDLILVEGFKADDFPKLEVFRPALGKPPLWPVMPGILAVATDDGALPCGLPLLPLNDATQIATWTAAFVAEWRATA